MPDKTVIDSIIIKMAVEGWVVTVKPVHGHDETHIFTDHAKFLSFIQEIIDPVEA